MFASSPALTHRPRSGALLRIRGWGLWLGVGLVATAGAGVSGDAGRQEPGLLVRFESRAPGAGVAFGWANIERPALFVAAASPPSPGLHPGPFDAEATGFLTMELRGTRGFQAEFRGRLRLEINGVAVLDGTSDGSTVESSQQVRLLKGTNALRMVFRSFPDGDAFFRLNWSSVEFASEPVDPGSLSHPPSEDLRRATVWLRGRGLFLDFQCANCHATSLDPGRNPELEKQAPRLDELGRQVTPDWLAGWILDPGSHRTHARMPAVLKGPEAARRAAAIAAYLGSLSGGLPRSEAGTGESGDANSGRRHYQTLQCGACHALPTETDADPSRVVLRGMARKFTSAELTRFLREPERRSPWIRMPNFRLSDTEAADLAAFLRSLDASGLLSPPVGGRGAVEEGRRVVATSGCLNCHPGPGANEFTARQAGSFDQESPGRGCLADDPSWSGPAPRFRFEPGEREALRAFLGSGLGTLDQHVPWEFARRQSADLNCRGCHGKADGVPSLDPVGGKLRPDWMHRLFEGDLDYKPRPWIAARMPAFPRRAALLAAGLAAAHGFGPTAPSAGRPDVEAAEMGRRLVSADGGFSCVACHAVGSLPAPRVPDGQGINLAHVSSRLLKPYFARWMRNPVRVDPATKMPVYFEAGRSPLVEFGDGDAGRQIEAIWQYLQLGERLPPPSGNPPP